MKKLKERLDPKYTKRAAYASVTTIITVMIILILYASRGVWALAWNLIFAVMKPLILGGVFCYLLVPVVDFFDYRLQVMRKKPWRCRGLAVIISLILVFGVISAILLVIILTMTKQLSSINYDAVIQFFENAQNDAEGLAKQIEKSLTSMGYDVSSLGTQFTGIISGIAGFISSLFFGIIFSIYFLVDGKRISRYWKEAGKVILSKKTIKQLEQIAKEADMCFSGYIRGQAIDALIVGTLASIALITAGMPYAFLVGIIIGIGNLIPYVGPILGYCAVIFINLTQFNPKMLVTGLIIVLVIMFIDSNVINPKLLAGSIKVHPLLVVASLLAGGAIGGIVGMLISVPMGAFVKLQFEKWIEYKKTKDNSQNTNLPQ